MVARAATTYSADVTQVRHRDGDPPADVSVRRILLVASSAEERALTLALLGGIGSAIETSDGAAAALARLERETFDLILMDMQALELDGDAALRSFREAERMRGQPPTPIIALHANASRERAGRWLEAGCDAHVAKPLDERALLEAVRSCCEPLEIEAVPELVDLLPDYFAHRRADLDSLWQALAEESWALVRRLGHDMKGSGRLYGLPRISAIGARIEAAAVAEERCEAALALAALESFLARAARSLFEPAPPSAAARLSSTRPASD